LRSSHWKKLRRKKLEAERRTCQWCGSRARLHVHHLNYRDLYDVTLADLAVLCERCHTIVHAPFSKKVRRRRKRRDDWRLRAAMKPKRNQYRSRRDQVRKLEQPINRMFREIRGLVP
jgi:5-methylcytosine-specific restriction endonuclease McrA